MDVAKLSTYVRIRVEHLLHSNSRLSVEAETRSDKAGESGCVFHVGPMIAIYFKRENVMQFYDAKAQLIATEQLPAEFGCATEGLENSAVSSES